jgi:hypothetical protein
MFWSAGCPLLRAEGFFCPSLDVLYGGLGIGKLQFWIKKILNIFFIYKFFSIFSNQNPGSGSGSNEYRSATLLSCTVATFQYCQPLSGTVNHFLVLPTTFWYCQPLSSTIYHFLELQPIRVLSVGIDLDTNRCSRCSSIHQMKYGNCQLRVCTIRYSVSLRLLFRWGSNSWSTSCSRLSLSHYFTCIRYLPNK